MSQIFFLSSCYEYFCSLHSFSFHLPKFFSSLKSHVPNCSLQSSNTSTISNCAYLLMSAYFISKLYIYSPQNINRLFYYGIKHAHDTKGTSRSDPFHVPCLLPWAPQVVLVVESPPINAGDVRDPGSIPGSGRYLEEGMATRSSILVWRNQWTEEPGGLQAMGLWSQI